ncbi:tRNA wybutosine-synthesizing protein 4 [Plakobranchus ocellatus]|uniref:tRNA wybutosine-synthesizing protein 4 n=1 Tax=Plakobranchus ocellatus TaxID=259542 RepID=A0AAV4CQY4_9GAST|nr:tRNA wybutosine-synthesizing protein 4 [Plakobranchus ocellatus]
MYQQCLIQPITDYFVMAKVMSTAPYKSSKTRRETAVQGTNDSSIVSKWSTAACGYFDDAFLQYFISKQSRRAPLIHRGYYIRAAAFERIIKKFFQIFKNTPKQIISLGAGFDSTYFRLKEADLLSDTFFCEIDFPDLVRRKRLLIENSPELSNLIQKWDAPPLSPHIELSCTDYQLLGVDLTQLNTVEAALKMCGVNFDCPTLLLSECVMTYMTRRCSSELVKWAAETFELAVFGMYEQINPDDAFGLFMQTHFHSVGSPLKCINSFPSLQSQEDRFLNAGWIFSEALDMNTFYYECLDQAERQRIESLETFDEYEELNLKYSHYFILMASTVNFKQSLLRNQNISPKSASAEAIPELVQISRLSEKEQSVRRFGHASSLENGRFVLTSGGFGETDGRHQRLAELTITDLDTFKSYHIPCGLNEMQIPRMHHSSVSLSNGSTILIGGRQSPYFMCNQMLKVTLQIDDDCDSSQTFLNQPCNADCTQDKISSSLATERVCFSSEGQRKTADDMLAKNIKSQSSPNSNDVTTAKPGHSVPTAENCPASSFPRDCEQLLNPNKSQHISQYLNFEVGKVSIEVVHQKGVIPKERWRQASVAVVLNGEEKVFLYGGKTKSGEVLQDAYMFCPQTNTWTEVCFIF